MLHFLSFSSFSFSLLLSDTDHLTHNQQIDHHRMSSISVETRDYLTSNQQIRPRRLSGFDLSSGIASSFPLKGARAGDKTTDHRLSG